MSYYINSLQWIQLIQEFLREVMIKLIDVNKDPNYNETFPQ